MRTLLVVIMIGLTVPAAGASELTDAITGADPRDRLETGEGAAFGSILGPKDEPAGESGRLPQPDDLPPSLSDYGSPYEDLRSSLYTSPLEDEDAGDEDEDEEDDQVGQPHPTPVE